MKKTSAGILIKDRRGFLLVHPGGPYYWHKRIKCWSIPKGEREGKEPLLKLAIRELKEETGICLNTKDHEFISLGSCSSNHKKLHGWMVIVDIPEDHEFRSNTFHLEYPKGSGVFKEYAEVDEFKFFEYEEAVEMITWYQKPLLDKADKILKERNG